MCQAKKSTGYAGLGRINPRLDSEYKISNTHVCLTYVSFTFISLFYYFTVSLLYYSYVYNYILHKVHWNVFQALGALGVRWPRRRMMITNDDSSQHNKIKTQQKMHKTVYDMILYPDISQDLLFCLKWLFDELCCSLLIKLALLLESWSWSWNIESWIQACVCSALKIVTTTQNCQLVAFC